MLKALQIFVQRQWTKERHRSHYLEDLSIHLRLCATDINRMRLYQIPRPCRNSACVSRTWHSVVDLFRSR